MGKIEYFEIIFDKPIFMGGEPLTGRVSIKSSDQIKINSVFINVTGSGKIQWLEKTVGEAGKQIITYENQTMYLNKHIECVKPTEKDFFLETGLTEFQFKCDLPEHLPTSFQHKIGMVRYLVKGTIDIPWAIDKLTEKSFTLVQHHDLNLNLSARQACGATADQSFGCGPCRSNPINVELNLLKSGYVPGESLDFKVFITNKTSNFLKTLRFALIQQTQFHAHPKVTNQQIKPKSRVENKEIASLYFPNQLEPNKDFTWDGSLKIPSICPTSSSHASRMIQVSYSVRLHFNPRSLGVGTDLCIPVIIGTVPLLPPKIQKTEENNLSEKVPQIGFIDKDGIPLVTLPSVSYEPFETLEKIEDNESGLVRNEFKPLYPYYTFLNSENKPSFGQ